MSNVLIGIIGVILFIGLALAGALYLGGSFTDASNQRRASQISMALSQTAQAASLFSLQNGSPLPNRLDSVDLLIASRYLKARPTNPTAASNYPIVVDRFGNLNDERPAFAIMYLGQGENALKACIAFEKASGNTDRLNPDVMRTEVEFNARRIEGRAGCARMPGAFGGANGGTTGDYLAWMPI